MKKIALFIAMLAVAFSASAQSNEDWKGAPHWFVGVQGGVATTLNSTYDWKDMIVPTASLQLGYWMAPEVGVRIHGNGVWTKAGMIAHKDGYDTKYMDGNLDLLLNLSTLFGNKDYYPVNIYSVFGVGYRHQWDKEDGLYFATESSTTPTKINSFNGRLGLGVEANLSKHWAVNAEVDYNHWNVPADKISNQQITAQVGLSYKFGYKKKRNEAPVAETGVNDYAETNRTEAGNASATVAATPKPAPKPEAKPAVVEEKKVESMQKNIYFAINQSQPGKVNTQKVVDAAQWLKAHPSAKCTVTGYADKGTGTAAINKRISQKRANTVANKLQALGVAADRIVVDAKGDTVQPFADNNENRVVIIEAK